MFKRKIHIAAIIFLVTTILLGPGSLTAEAAGSISVYGNATLAGNSVDLGYMIIEVPPGALSDGDTMALTLPEGFTFNTASPVALSSTLGDISETTVSVVYPSIGGRQNAVSGIIAAGYSGSGTLKIAVTGNPLPNEKSTLYIYMKGIKTPSGYLGEVELTINSSGGWPSSLEGALGYDYKKDLPKEEPPQPPEKDIESRLPEKINASFRIGEGSYTVDGSVNTMDAAPFLKDGRTYLPVRYVALTCGAAEENISYKNNTVTIDRGNKWIKLSPG
ncbi:MAG: stalk domain-containing protein, partial [Desulfocucumaceae bacterium]